MEHVKRKYCFFYPIVWNNLFLQPQNRRWTSGNLRCNNIRRQRYHTDIADFGNQRYGTGRPWVCFQYENLTVFDSILHIHKPSDMHFFGDFPRVFLNGFHIFIGYMHRRDNAGRVPGVDTCQLNMLHNCRNKSMGTIADSIRLAFQSMVQKPVNQNRAIRCYPYCRIHIFRHAYIVIHHFHAPASQNIGRAHHNRITDSSSNGNCFFHRGCHAGFRHRNPQLIHHFTELIPVLSQIYNRRGSP